jgi:signal transduction histidine kinase
VKPDTANAWIRNAAIRAAKLGSVDEDRELPHETTLRLHAERFTLASGTPMVAVAAADKIELEDQYAALIGVFGIAALVALVMVALGGSILVGKSAEPVERTMDQMRQFMADAAHELRTPITVLRSRAEIALQQPRDSESYVATLKGVESESMRLGRIVDDLLILARADAGDRPIERKTFLLDETVLDAAAAASSVAQSRQVSIAIGDLDHSLIDGDSTLVRQLVMILLDNAVKFTPSGGQVNVGVSSRDGSVVLSVEDSGIGIATDQMPRVFDRFYRGDSARGHSEGAGLGLSIARWIADAHRAEIAIISTVGQGTRVDVRFPAVTSAV